MFKSRGQSTPSAGAAGIAALSWFCQGVTDTILPILFAEAVEQDYEKQGLSSPMDLVVDFILTLAVSIMIGLILKCGRDCFIRKEGV